MQGKLPLEIGLPGIMVDDMRHTGQEIFPGAPEKSIAARHAATGSDRISMVSLNVIRPLIRVGIRSSPQTPEMIHMQVIMGVDQAGMELPIPHHDAAVER